MKQEKDVNLKKKYYEIEQTCLWNNGKFSPSPIPSKKQELLKLEKSKNVNWKH